MTEKRDEASEDFSANNADDRLISDRVQELTWAVLDEQINDDEFVLLENLLLSDENARGSYIGCVQLHADLMAHFAGSAANTDSKAGGGSQILGFLNSDAPLGLQSPSAENTT
jgi:hypothetical protein